MKSSNIFETLIKLNCEEIYLLNSNILDNASFLDEINGVKVMGRTPNRVLGDMARFAKSNSGFKVGFYKYPIGKSCKWLFNLIYEYDKNCYRVQLENYKCPSCDNQIIIANPSAPSLYDTVNKKNEIMEEVSKLQHISCPHCKTRIERLAIWAGKTLLST